MRQNTKRRETAKRNGAQGLRCLCSGKWSRAGGGIDVNFQKLLSFYRKNTVTFFHILLFRHIIDLVDFFEGVSESVIVMQFAEGFSHLNFF